MFDHLEDLEAFRRNDRAPSKPRATFPCQSCAGTGIYKGFRVNQPETKCFPCKGRGHFATSAFDRSKARTQRAAREADKRKSGVEAFEAANPGVLAFLKANGWSGFLRDMLDNVERRGTLSDGQLAAVRATQAKVAARDAERNAKRDVERAARSAEVNLASIFDMFDKARESGLSRLAYRAEGLVISPAKATSANAGALYVKTTDGEYLGKVVGEKFLGTREATDEHKAALAKIATNPADVAKSYGQKTGRCSCCGRELTDPVSIAAGIGPDCAENWGF